MRFLGYTSKVSGGYVADKLLEQALTNAERLDWLESKVEVKSQRRGRRAKN